MSRRLPTLVVVSLASLVLAACTTSEAFVDPAAETISIEHKYGTTEVPVDPERVVTVGWNDQDFALSLGVVPVAIRDWFDNYDDFPWVQEATGGETLERIADDGDGGIGFESVADADPDVILAIYESIDEDTYEKLSSIAPTVVQSDDYPDEETPWDVQLLTTGKALSKEAEAEALVDEVQGAIDQAKQDHPELADAVLVEDYGPLDGGHYLIGAGDPRRTLFDALGLQAQSTVGDVSEERLSLLDEDVLYVDGATQDEMLDDPLFAALDVVKDERTLYASGDSDISGALSFSGPDALLYAIDTLVPKLADALAGKPVGDLS